MRNFFYNKTNFYSIDQSLQMVVQHNHQEEVIQHGLAETDCRVYADSVQYGNFFWIVSLSFVTIKVIRIISITVQI